ncbi:CcmD family protein [Sphingobacterium paucimobilis]|uniref:CcmD family protein n=1 Tax=Sphingobacterium paucimobilis TaxID=1385985 RepID=UPI0009DBE64D|nr:CcmD family protein [Sphingobacterium paucimobilis]
MKKISLLTLLTFLTTLVSYAQSSDIEMAEGLRSSGKIWVVVLVLLTIVVGVFVYLFTIDRKVTKLEKRNS